MQVAQFAPRPRRSSSKRPPALTRSPSRCALALMLEDVECSSNVNPAPLPAALPKKEPQAV